MRLGSPRPTGSSCAIWNRVSFMPSIRPLIRRESCASGCANDLRRGRKLRKCLWTTLVILQVAPDQGGLFSSIPRRQH
jgi:hypothetical protein